MPYVLPLLAAVLYFDTLRTADGFPPVWTLRASVIPNHMLIEFSAFAGGLAAWAGSREGRRKTLDLVATTPRAAWARLGAALAGTLCWLLLAFLAGVAVLYVQTALQATWGGPAAVAGARRRGRRDRRDRRSGSPAVSSFPAGSPRRWSPSACSSPSRSGSARRLDVTASSGTYALLSPISVPPPVETGVYYHVPPDVPIVQVMFMGGIAVALFGVLSLAPGLRQLARPRQAAPRRLAAVTWSLRRRGRPGRAYRASWPRSRCRHRALPPPAGRSRRCTPRPAISRCPSPRTARPGPHSRCASTRRSASIPTTWRRRSIRWPPRSRACPARRSAPEKWRA